MLLFAASAAHGNSDWPNPESIVGVSVLVFEHASAPEKTAAQEGLTQFPGAIRLPTVGELRTQSEKDQRRAQFRGQSDNASSVIWSTQNWLSFMHSGVLLQLDQPLTGPPLPPRPAKPLLNAPLLMRQSATLPSDVATMVDRLSASDAHTLLEVAHWYQLLQRQTTSPQISLGGPANGQPAPWSSLAWWADSTPDALGAKHLVGYVQLNQSQFLRANLEVWLHEAAHQDYGPLKASHLYPTGFRVVHLKTTRSIEPNRWVYFDSEALGVLIKVTPR